MMRIIRIAVLLNGTVTVIGVTLLTTMAPHVIGTLGVRIRLELVTMLMPRTLSLTINERNLLSSITMEIMLMVDGYHAIVRLLHGLNSIINVINIMLYHRVIMGQTIATDRHGVC